MNSQRDRRRGVRQAPSATWINTFRFAAALKVAGIVIAMTTARFNSDTWAFDRWWGALLTGLLLLALLLPWYRLAGGERLLHAQMIGALLFAIVAFQLDLLQSSYASYDLLAANERFQLLIGWDRVDVNNVHALGSLFVTAPIVLASWQYGYRGLLLSLGLAGGLYILAPLWLPAGAFDWWFYTVRGFVQLGVTLIVAFIVTTLAREQRRSAQIQAQLAISEERNRLARDLHDTLAHTLSASAVQLEAVQLLLQHDPAQAQRELDSARGQIRTGLQEARRAIKALRPTLLQQHGLAQAIQRRAAATASRNGWRLTLQLDPLPPLPPAVEQVIFRIVEEGLTNCERHAAASAVAINAAVQRGRLLLTIADDGAGFDRTTAAGYGLRGMRERAQQIDAELTVESGAGVGTTITLSRKL